MSIKDKLLQTAVLYVIIYIHTVLYNVMLDILYKKRKNSTLFITHKERPFNTLFSLESSLDFAFQGILEILAFTQRVSYVL